jgi:hypothetical protein
MRILEDYRNYHILLWRKGCPIIHYEMLYLSFEMLDGDYDYVLCLKFDYPQSIFCPDGSTIAQSLEALFYKYPDAFVILTQRKNAPHNYLSIDENIYSFSCNFHHFKRMIKELDRSVLLADNLLFELLHYIGQARIGFNEIFVRQIPFESALEDSCRVVDVVIPHRGRITYLFNLLKFLRKIDKIKVFIGLDQPMPLRISTMISYYPEISFYSFEPDPVGPYVIRNRLADSGKSEFLFFQDSDDIPCADRFAKLSNYMALNEVQLCGSHEIRMDYYRRSVKAVRYPLDVKAALDIGPAYALLHPTSAIRREDFLSCGGLSEEKIFAIDSKFLYYCYFKLQKIHNIDEFLYIRRIHPKSLTTSPLICIGSDKRQYLINRWVVDFILIQQGLLKLEESCLTFECCRFNYKIQQHS